MTNYAVKPPFGVGDSPAEGKVPLSLLAEPRVKGAKLERLGWRLDGLWRSSARLWAPARAAAVECWAFYDGDQWAEYIKRALMDEDRPPVVVNGIFRAINNVLGREAASRFRYDLAPTTGRDVRAAEEMTRALDWQATESDLDMAVSDAFENAVKGPMGWLLPAYNDFDPTIDPYEVTAPNPFNVYIDPWSRHRGLKDARFLTRVNRHDLDEVLSWYPWAREAVMGRLGDGRGWDSEAPNALVYGEDYGNREGPVWAPGLEWSVAGWYDEERNRVALGEHWWWENEPCDVVKLPDGRTVEYKEGTPATERALRVRGARRRQGVKRCYYYAITAGTFVLYTAKSPYKLQRYPYVPVWCYRDRFGMPYGMISTMRWPQVELNVARSRFNESIRSTGVFYNKGTLTPEEQRAVEQALTRPNFAVGLTNLQGLQVVDRKADSALWLQLMETARNEIDEVPGQNEAAYGDKSNEKSGVAIERRVEQQNQNLGRLWDNLRWARKEVGTRFISYLLQFEPKERLARILEAANLEEGKPVDLSWLDEYDDDLDPVGQVLFRVKILDQAETATERRAAMQQAIDLSQFVPEQIRGTLVPFLLRMSDFPDKEEMAKVVEQGIQAMMQPPEGAGPGMMPLPGALPPGMGP